MLAAADGRVVYAGSGLRGYGNLVILKHNPTYLTAYAHNQALLVKDDQTVRAGQKIAEMGSTDADSVQLHFEIRSQGKPIDPVAPAAAALSRRPRRPHVLLAGPRLRHRVDSRHRRPARAARRDRGARRRRRSTPPRSPTARPRGKSDFMPLHLQRVLVISCVFRNAEGLRVHSLVDREATGAARKAA